jgi:hypothetical protein
VGLREGFCVAKKSRRVILRRALSIELSDTSRTRIEGDKIIEKKYKLPYMS